MNTCLCSSRLVFRPRCQHTARPDPHLCTLPQLCSQRSVCPGRGDSRKQCDCQTANSSPCCRTSLCTSSQHLKDVPAGRAQRRHGDSTREELSSADSEPTDRLDGDQSPFVPRFGSLLAQDPHAHLQIAIVAEVAHPHGRSSRLQSTRRLLRGLCICPETAVSQTSQGFALLCFNCKHICQTWSREQPCCAASSRVPEPRRTEPPAREDGTALKGSHGTGTPNICT